MHNLQALESHVMQMHIPYSLTCNWDGCRDQNPRAAAGMWKHAQDAHVHPMAWKFGDGPKVPVTGEKKDSTFAFDIVVPEARL
jgi:hypothetical protein